MPDTPAAEPTKAQAENLEAVVERVLGAAMAKMVASRERGAQVDELTANREADDVISRQADPEKRLPLLGALAFGMVAAKRRGAPAGDSEAVIDTLIKGGGYGATMGRALKAIYTRAPQSTLTPDAGGVFVDPVVSHFMWDPLSAAAIMGNLGLEFRPGSIGGTRMTGADTEPTTTMRAENVANTSTTEVGFRESGVDMHGFQTICPFTWELLGSALGPQVAAYIERRITLSIARKIDSQVLTAAGGSGFINGLYNRAVMAGNTTPAATPGTAFVDANDDCLAASLFFANNNVELRRPALIMNPKTWAYLYYALGSNSDTRPYQMELAAGSLNGYRVGKTTLIPSNLGGGTDTYMIFVDLDGVYFHLSPMSEMRYFEGASYVSGGTTYHTLQTGQTVLETHGWMGMGVPQNQVIHVITGVPNPR